LRLEREGEQADYWLVRQEPQVGEEVAVQEVRLAG
jgi:hypothetical protein